MLSHILLLERRLKKALSILICNPDEYMNVRSRAQMLVIHVACAFAILILKRFCVFRSRECTSIRVIKSRSEIKFAPSYSLFRSTKTYFLDRVFDTSAFRVSTNVSPHESCSMLFTTIGLIIQEGTNAQKVGQSPILPSRYEQLQRRLVVL